MGAALFRESAAHVREHPVEGESLMVAVVQDVVFLASKREVVGLAFAGNPPVAYRFSFHDRFHDLCSLVLNQFLAREVLIHLHDEFLHVQGRGFGRFGIEGYPGVAENKSIGSLYVDDRFLLDSFGCVTTHARHMQQVVQGHLVVGAELGEGF